MILPDERTTACEVPGLMSVTGQHASAWTRLLSQVAAAMTKAMSAGLSVILVD